MHDVRRDEIEAWPGLTVLEFGASWCGVCNRARSLIDRVLGDQPGLRHEWIEDGSGKPLGRSFRVKLWPTLVVLRDGVEVARVVRPRAERELRDALAAA